MKKGLKDIVAPQGMFEDLGLKYLGPVDGHDIAALERTLEQAKKFEGPVIVHAITEKGRGYAPAIKDEAEKFHAVGVVDPETGESIAKAGRTWTEEFSDALLEIGRARKEVVAITAAMLGPTGLDRFQKEFPDRIFDVGIAEQHAVTSAAGLAFTGLHPVVSVYSTFLNRAFDQLLLDVSLHNAGVTFVLDRAGFTGDDGPSHNGVWDLALTGIVPSLKVAAPRDGIRLRELLAESIDINSPSLLRYPKGIISSEIPAFESRNGIDFLYRGESTDILLIAVGAMAQISVDAATQANREGVGVTVIDPRWVKPLPIEFLSKLSGKYRQVVVVEDGIAHGGIASTLSEGFRALDLEIPIHSIGAPLEFFEHGKRNQILEELGITSQTIARQIVGWYSQSSTQEVKRFPVDGNVDQRPQR
jgi:1-deoxy-D-xylulose-5-phosphate synthase